MKNSCPSIKTLRQFVSAALSPTEADAILTHLDSCDPCQKKVAQLEQEDNDSFVMGMRDVKEEMIEHVNRLPVTVGQYEVVELLGFGGMGIVYRARNPHLDSEVAVKVIKETRLTDPTSKERFTREIKAIGKLNDRNTVRALDAGVDHDSPFLVMELLDGDDLGSHIRTHGPMSIDKACDVIRQAANGLVHAHAAGIIHRDIKPSNLFLTADGCTKILDLGLVKSASFGEPTDATSDHILGSPDFMAPEQLRKEPVDARTDIYSLGCTLFYLLTAQPPFTGPDYPNVAAVIGAQQHVDLPRLQKYRNDIPGEFRELIERMTAKHPAKRFQNAGKLIDALDSLDFSRPATHLSKQIKLALISFLLIVVFLTIPTIFKPKMTSVSNSPPSSGLKNNVDSSPKTIESVPYIPIKPSQETGEYFQFAVNDPNGYDRFFAGIVEQSGPFLPNVNSYELFSAFCELKRYDVAEQLLENIVRESIDSDPADFENRIRGYCALSDWEWKVGRSRESEDWLVKANELTAQVTSEGKRKDFESIIEQCRSNRNRREVLLPHDFFIPDDYRAEDGESYIRNGTPSIVNLCNDKRFDEAVEKCFHQIISETTRPQTKKRPGMPPSPTASMSAPAFPRIGVTKTTNTDYALIYMFKRILEVGDFDEAKRIWLGHDRHDNLSDSVMGFLLLKELLKANLKSEAQHIADICFSKVRDHRSNIASPIFCHALKGLSKSGLYDYVVNR